VLEMQRYLCRLNVQNMPNFLLHMSIHPDCLRRRLGSS
jgi:hypothetical protein